MNKAVFDLALVNDKDSWHLEAIAKLAKTDTMSFQHRRLKSTNPGMQTKQLREGAFYQTKSSVKVTLRVTDVFDTLQFVTGEITLSRLVFRHVNKDHLGAAGLNVFAFLRNISQSFPTKSTTKVPQKNE